MSCTPLGGVDVAGLGGVDVAALGGELSLRLSRHPPALDRYVAGLLARLRAADPS